MSHIRNGRHLVGYWVSTLLLSPALANAAEPVYEVVSPLGESIVEMVPMAKRLDTLDGKTVCMTWNDAFKANLTHATLAGLIQQQYRNVEIVPYTELPLAHLAEVPGNPQPLSQALRAAYKQKGCDAVISGNGG